MLRSFLGRAVQAPSASGIFTFSRIGLPDSHGNTTQRGPKHRPGGLLSRFCVTTQTPVGKPI
eukprot:13429859-Alexandrium_andersonii.AAC.1